MDSGREANKQTKLSSFFNKSETYTLPSRWLIESSSPPAKKRPVGRPRKNFATEEPSSLESSSLQPSVTSSAENHDGNPTPPQLSSSAQSTEQPSKAILTLRPHKDDSDDLSEKENVQASPSSKGVPERGKYKAYSVAEKQAIVLEAKERGIRVTAADKRIAGKLKHHCNI